MLQLANESTVFHELNGGIMRLNLPSRNCVSFSVFSMFTVSEKKDAEIQEFMERTLTRLNDDDDGVSVVAFYGSVSRAGGIVHRVSASLTKNAPIDGRIAIALALSNDRYEGRVTEPPRGIQSVNHLIDALSGLFGPIEVTCHALFEYERARGFTSKVQFPIPLILQDAPDGITHIESAQFSRRNADGVLYAITVGESDNGAGIGHSVDFETTASLGQSEIRDLFDHAAKASMRLVSLG